MAESKDLIMVHVNVEITTASLKAIVENVKHPLKLFAVKSEGNVNDKRT